MTSFKVTDAISTQIEQGVKNVPGWSPQDQLMTLFTLGFSSAHLPGDILELGSWCGRSAIALGLAAKLSGEGHVHCIDLFPEASDWHQNKDGTYSLVVNIKGKKYGAYGDQTVWAEPFKKDIQPVYERFEGTLDAFNQAINNVGLNQWVTPYRMDLEGFTKVVTHDQALRLAFIDGDHSYAAVSNDIKLVEKYLLSDGWICFDDAFSSYEGVNEAIQKYVIDSGKYKNFQQITRKCFIAQLR